MLRPRNKNCSPSKRRSVIRPSDFFVNRFARKPSEEYSRFLKSAVGSWTTPNFLEYVTDRRVHRFPLDDLLHIFEARYIPDLYDLYDLYYMCDQYDLAHVAGRESYNLRDPLMIGHVSGVEPVLFRSCTVSHDDS